MSENCPVPILNDIAPDGFFYGGHYVVEFDPASLWYETSLTIAALALRQGTKTEYHVFQHYPSEVLDAISRLGVDARELEKAGLLSIWDSYSATVQYEEEKERMEREKGNAWISTLNKPLDIKASKDRWIEAARAGGGLPDFKEEEKGWLHLDDNTSIFLQYNDEETFVDAWRTGVLPYGIRARKTPHFLAFVKGVASASFYSKFEALCDGIIDLKTQEEEGQIGNYIRVRMLRGKTFDSHWHRIQLSSSGEVTLVAAPSEKSRRLAAIMFTDIVGYTAMAQADEPRALEALKKHRELIRPLFAKHAGIEVKTMGDAFLIEFPSALAAAECAVDIEQSLYQHNKENSENLQVRIGVHVGDVVHEGGDVYGDAVNIASRIEPLASGGGTCISQQVYDQIRNKLPRQFIQLEARDLKNVSIPIAVYRLKPLEDPKLIR